MCLCFAGRWRDCVFHTYSTYARGTDNLGFISNFLDLTPARPAGAEGTRHRVRTGTRNIPRYHDE